MTDTRCNEHLVFNEMNKLARSGYLLKWQTVSCFHFYFALKIMCVKYKFILEIVYFQLGQINLSRCIQNSIK